MKKAKIMQIHYPTAYVICEWNQVVPPAVYALYVLPKGGYENELVRSLKVSEPVITAVSTSDTLISVSGTFFTNKKPKVYFLYEDEEGKSKNKKFTVQKYNMNVNTGSSLLEAKKKTSFNAINGGYLFIETKIGEDSYWLNVLSIPGNRPEQQP
jgi:hypothetical protein